MSKHDYPYLAKWNDHFFDLLKATTTKDALRFEGIFFLYLFYQSYIIYMPFQPKKLEVSKRSVNYFCMQTLIIENNILVTHYNHYKTK